MEKLLLKREEGEPKTQSILAPITVEFFEGTNGFDLGVEEKIILGNEAAKRACLAKDLTNAFSKIGQNTPDSASEKGLIKQQETDQMFEDLADFILDDPNNVRLILYLPFQVFPDLNENLTSAKQKFGRVLRDGWIRLLFESEIRANFDDGDELEPALGAPPQTRKAAHLLPEFLKRGIVSEVDLVKLLKINSGDTELTQSLLEGAIVAKDDNLIGQQVWDEIQAMPSIQKACKLLPKGVSKPVGMNLTIDQIATNLNSDLIQIENEYTSDSDYLKRVSPKRIVWEKSVKIDNAIETASQQIASKLISGEITISDAEEFKAVGIRGVVRAAEIIAKKEPEKARIFVEKALPMLRIFWRKGSPAEKDEIRFGASHLMRLNALPESFLADFEIVAPDLSVPLPIDLNSFIENDGKPIAEAAKKIQENPILSKYFYPFILAFGSKIKGYADRNGDFDIAVFIKPGVSWQERKDIVHLLKKHVPELNSVDKVLEFWINETDGKFCLNSISENSPKQVVGEDQIHFILGGVWIGDHQDLQKLRADLASRYLNLTRYGKQKEAVRYKLLRQLELDVLQYRLMHKGYKKYYPSKKETPITHGNLIDWRSDFWDPGYRKIATLLFLNKVFLPDLS